MVKFLCNAALLLAIVPPVSAQVDDPTLSPRREFSRQEISDIASLKRLITRKGGCKNSPIRVQIDTLVYFDFEKNGSKGIVVDASTCNAGTAGPDVHSVFFRDGKGGLYEVPVPDADRKYYARLEGNRNYFLSVDLKSGLLVATWWDKPDGSSSGRSERLVVRYRWNGKKFVVASVVDGMNIAH